MRLTLSPKVKCRVTQWPGQLETMPRQMQNLSSRQLLMSQGTAGQAQHILHSFFAMVRCIQILLDTVKINQTILT